eukprot:scaffold192_cov320-Ochromonas_danica.AAC.37
MIGLFFSVRVRWWASASRLRPSAPSASRKCGTRWAWQPSPSRPSPFGSPQSSNRSTWYA